MSGSEPAVWSPFTMMETGAAPVAGIELGRILAGQKHSPVVYFVWCAGAVKIGTTVRLRSRIRSLYLRLSDVILVVPGGREVERAYHDALAQYRIDEPGRRELFALDGILGALHLNWHRPSARAFDPSRSIGVPFRPSPVVWPKPTGKTLPAITLECRNGHQFSTRAHGNQSVGCPLCKAGGERVNVWVPKARPQT